MSAVLLTLYHQELNTYLIPCRRILNPAPIRVKLNLRPLNSNLKPDKTHTQILSITVFNSRNNIIINY